ncbi:TPA: hypothetical protein NJ627_003566 [Vibrio parahaemolyticus]|nr:hypothetical protein [Vibrio parahaemolyticus]
MKDMEFAKQVIAKEIDRINKSVEEYVSKDLINGEIEIAEFKLRSMMTLGEFMEDIEYPAPSKFDFHESDSSLEVLETYELLCDPILEELREALYEEDVTADEISSTIKDYLIMLQAD